MRTGVNVINVIKSSIKNVSGDVKMKKEFKCKECGSKKWTVYGPIPTTICKNCGTEYIENEN